MVDNGNGFHRLLKEERALNLMGGKTCGGGATVSVEGTTNRNAARLKG
eukprot:gene625-345_t